MFPLDVSENTSHAWNASTDFSDTSGTNWATSASYRRKLSELDLETKRNTVAVDEAQVQAAQAALENAQLNLDYCYVHSPIDGRAGARLVDVGNVVQANTTALLLIQRIDPIYADFTVTERDFPQVQPQMANGTLQARVRLPSDSDSGARVGAVTFLDNAVQPGTGTVNLRATIRNADRHFWPGQFVNVQLILTTAKAVLVPSQATQISQEGPFVYVVKPDQTIELRPVTPGQRQGDDAAATDVQAAISQAQGQLPIDLPTPPTFTKTNPNDQPILYVGLASDSATLGQLYDYASTQVGERISILPGVSQVVVYGTQSAVRIKANPSAMAARNLTMDDLVTAVKNGTAYTGAGQLDGASRTFLLQPQGQLSEARQYR